MKIVSSRRFALWTRELLRWLSRKFDSISIDLTPVEDKLDEVKSDVADVKEAVENIDIDTSDLAKEATLATIGSNASTDFSIIKDAVKKNGTSVIDAVNYNIQQVSNQQGYLQNTIAKEATLGAAPIGSDKNTVFQYLAAILDNIEGQGGEDIPEGLGDRINLLLEFFGLPQALPEYQPITETEVKAMNDDAFGALYGYGKVTVTIHALMRTGAETTQDLASIIYVDPNQTWAENGYVSLYDDEGTAIDATTNPSEGDEVYLYQITQNS